MGVLHVWGQYIIWCVYLLGFCLSFLVGTLVEDSVEGDLLVTSIRAFVGFYSLRILIPLFTILLKWTLLGRLKPGRVRVTKWRLFCHWLIDRLLLDGLHRDFITDTFSNSYLNNFIHLAFGVNISPGDTLFPDAFLQSDLDLIRVKKHAFVASGVRISCSRFDGPDLVFEPVTIHSFAMVGDGAVLCPGTVLHSGSTLGAKTLACDNFVAQSDEIWVGSPAVLIQTASVKTHQSAVQELAGSQDIGSQNTSVAFYLATLGSQILQIFFLVSLVSISMISWTFLCDYLSNSDLWNAAIASDLGKAGLYATALYVISGTIMTLLCLLAGSCLPPLRGAHPRFGWYYVYWTFMAVILEMAYSYFFQFFEGTSVITAFMRGMGGTVGSDVYYIGGIPREIKCMTIEDGVVVSEAGLVGHSNDHNRLQFGDIVLRKNVSLNRGVNVQPGTQIGAGCTVGPNSVVLKGESLPENSYWQGIPLVLCSANLKLCFEQPLEEIHIKTSLLSDASNCQNPEENMDRCLANLKGIVGSSDSQFSEE